MPTTLYGIKNCDTIRKARKWLEAHGIDYQFHDVRSGGLDESQLKHWIKALGWETLLNKRGMSWRKLADVDKQELDADKAMQLMLLQPAMIKRPILEHNSKLFCGFSEANYQTIFGK